MPRKVKAIKANPAVKAPIRAIAVMGFLNKGINGLAALRKTPRIAPSRKTGYLEIVFQKLCMIQFTKRVGRLHPLKALFNLF